MITGKRIVAVFVMMIMTVVMFGCSDRSQIEGKDHSESLLDDASRGLQGAIFEDYTRLTIVRGSLYKYSIDPRKPQYLGIAIGALQSMVLTKEYEYDRFTRLENISPEIKREVIAQPLLNIVIKKKDVLSHAYSEVLDPLMKQTDSGKPVTPDQIRTINELVKILDKIVGEYATLSKEGLDYNGREAEDAFFRLQSHHKELQKLKLPQYVAPEE